MKIYSAQGKFTLKVKLTNGAPVFRETQEKSGLCSTFKLASGSIVLEPNMHPLENLFYLEKFEIKL